MIFRFVYAALSLGILCWAAPQVAPTFDATSIYEQRTMQGWKIYINPKTREHPVETEAALNLLDEKLAEIARIVAPEPLKRLRQFPFWVEWDGPFSTAMTTHVSAEWLRQNGHNPEKVLSVELVNPLQFVKWTREEQPMMPLHELAHAYHHQFLTRENPEILNAFQNAVKSGKYESVPYVHGQNLRAYALTNDTEYFAELTEAWFGRNDYYPFSRHDMKGFDPDGYALMAHIWGEPREPYTQESTHK